MTATSQALSDDGLPEAPKQTPSFVGGELISGRYRVEGLLGEGGMACAFRVHDQESGRKLALKRLTKASNAKLLALFEREYHTLASLRHPAIVEAYDYAPDDMGPYYTMELLEGADVSSLGPTPWPEVCRILRDVASGVALLHARRLLHRDLSARNVWLMPDRRIKLIDFGTLASFGKPQDIVGTPPFVAPEVLRGVDLDQRVDLYALGALAYFLLTGRHAFPARSMQMLETVWKTTPRPASRRVADLARQDLPEVPAALDELIASLLSQEALARPTTAADLIDRLSVIASLAPEQPVRVLESYLRTPAFVGRESERATLRSALAEANAGKAANVTVESSAGFGRSRLLQELALEARLSGTTVLQVDGRSGLGTHEAAQEYAFRLLAALPEAARDYAKPYAATLGHLSPELRERLQIRSEELLAIPQTHGEARMRVQAALLGFLLDVARVHPILIIADDVDLFDEGSAAWLAALSREAKTHKLFIASSTRVERAPYSMPVQALRQRATRLVLEALAPAETLELFRSVFGEAAYLPRLVDRLHQHAEGNPGHAIDLAEHLSRQGVIAYAGGAWLLPLSMDEVALPASRVDAELGRLSLLSQDARLLGQTLSVCEGAISLSTCSKLAGLEGAPLFEGLEALVRADVLGGSAEGYRFTRESLRLALNTELAPESKKRAHVRLGHDLLSTPNLTPLDRLRAGVHLLQGGAEEEGSLVVAQGAQHYALVDLADLGPAAPSLERALPLFRAAKRSPHELASLLAPLALAGYYADRRFGVRYGMEAVSLLEGLVGLSTARRLQPWLGKKLGLFLALGLAALGFARRRKNPRVPKFQQAMMMMFNCVAALTGASTICLDRAAARRYAKVLEPMTALGPDHVATFMYEFTQNLVATLSDSPGDARSRWTHMIARLDTDKARRDLGDVHVLYLAGALYADGTAEGRRDQSAALAYAERLDGFGLKLYDMSADQVRLFYYANRGDLEAMEHYAQKVEIHAIQRGTAWQVETWRYNGLMIVHLRTGDVAGLKECAEQLKRISADMPALVPEYNRALAAYLVLRGTPAEALQVMDSNPDLPGEMLGWSRCEGVRARAYNDLNDHARAREVCLRALDCMTDEDLMFSGNALIVVLELARAEAGLGELSAAEERLRELLALFGVNQNPLTMGALHETLAEIARQRGDTASFNAHVAEVERWFRPTRHPALMARCDRLTQSARPRDDSADERAGELGHSNLMTVLHNLQHGGDSTVSGSAEWVLKQLSSLTDVAEAYLFVSDHDGRARCVAGTHPNKQLGEMLAEHVRRLLAASAAMTTRTMGPESLEGLEQQRVQLDDKGYRLIALREGSYEERLVGALVVSDEAEVPSEFLHGIAARLHTGMITDASFGT